MGRPKLDNPRSAHIRVRVTPKELALLRREAKKARAKFADWCRRELGLGR